ELARIDGLQRCAVAHQRAQVAAAGGDDLFRHAIGFRVDGRGIERLLAVRDAQETGRLFEGAVAEPGDLEQVLAAGECAVLVAVGDDGSGNRPAEDGYAGKQRCRRHVEIDTDGVHRIFDDGIQRAGELTLIDIVLVLADADRLRLDLYQFGQ